MDTVIRRAGVVYKVVAGVDLELCELPALIVDLDSGMSSVHVGAGELMGQGILTPPRHSSLRRPCIVQRLQPRIGSVRDHVGLILHLFVRQGFDHCFGLAARPCCAERRAVAEKDSPGERSFTASARANWLEKPFSLSPNPILSWQEPVVFGCFPRVSCGPVASRLARAVYRVQESRQTSA